MNNAISLHGRCQKSRGKRERGVGKKKHWILLPFLSRTSPSPPLPSPPFACVCHTGYNVMHAKQGLVPERPINANPGLKFCSVVV